ncbi:MAG: DUF2997 domain-containing protein [Thermoguttaceae bacterium]
MTRSIEIIVTPEGKTSVQTLGFTGPSCRDASRFIEQALGQRASERLTAEFHEAEPVVERAGQRV